MSIIYVDQTSGNDTTGDGSAGNPYLTTNKATTVAVTGDEIRLAKTAAHTTVSSANFTFTDGSVTVNTDADVSATFTAGTYIGKTTATGNGGFETFYRVNSSNATTLTLETKYYGTTATVASVLKATIVQDLGVYPTTSYGSYLLNKNLTVSGGWNLSGTPAQDGETWYKGGGANRTTTWTAWFLDGTSVLTMSKVNIVETRNAIRMTTTVGYMPVLSYLTMVGIYDLVFPTISEALSFSYCVLQWASTGAGHLYTTSGTVTLNYVMLMGVGGTGMYANSTAALLTINFTNGIISNFASGIQNNITTSAASKIILTGSVVRYCTSGLKATGPNFKVQDGTISYCTDGFTHTTNISAAVFTNVNTNNSTNAGFSFNQGWSFDVTGGTSTNDKYGVYVADVYSHDIKVAGRTFVTPTTYAIYSAAGSDTIYVTDCSIDAPSTAKAYYEVAGNFWAAPRFLMHNYTNGPSDGAYYPNFSLVQTAAVYRTSAPSLQATFKATNTQQLMTIPIYRTYVNAGQGQTLGIWIEALSGWTGTIIPIVKLNGNVIYTGSTISSLTTSWVQYTYTITSDLVTDAGVLELCMIPNATTHAFFFDDFTASNI